MEMNRAHIVCIPFPRQGHINPMMRIAKLFHSRGFYVTFVLSDYAYNLILGSGGLDSTKVFDRFRFELIADDLLPRFEEYNEDIEEFYRAYMEEYEKKLSELIAKLQHSQDGLPPVTCAIPDAFMLSAAKVVEEKNIASVRFYPPAACSLMAFLHYPELISRGLVPLKDESCKTNGYLDTVVDWIPGMGEMKLKDLGSFLQITNPNDFILQSVVKSAQHTSKASKIIFNTFDDLEHDVVDALRAMLSSSMYTIGPLNLLCGLIVPDNQVKSIKSSLWAEETKCLEWLDNFNTGSVIYVNFGSSTTITPQQLIEFAWGIANSNHPFLWVIRPDLVKGVDQSSLSQEFLENIEGRGMVVSWCPQEEVLSHPSVAFFLTHCGWNSTLESISHGVPMLCWPFYAEQQINCRYACKEWGVGMEINSNATREEIGVCIQEFTEGEKGKEIRKVAWMWKRSAEDAVSEGGSSRSNFDRLMQDLLQTKNN